MLIVKKDNSFIQTSMQFVDSLLQDSLIERKLFSSGENGLNGMKNIDLIR
jgi:hypothetical protein